MYNGGIANLLYNHTGGYKMGMNHYVIVNGKPVREEDIRKWAEWFETADRQVARETIGDSEISTVFLGLDHAFRGEAPKLYETLVFGGKLDQEMQRYTTPEQAAAGHKEMVQRVKDARI
jgi:hypothetical protein